MKNKINLTSGVMSNVGSDVASFLEDVTDDLSTSYMDIFNTMTDKIEQLAQIEELILQRKCMTNVDNIKLSILREYIYARTPFYRRNKTSKDIRVIVGRIDLIYPTNPNPSLEDLSNDKGLILMAKDILIKTMTKEYQKNVAVYYQYSY